MIFQWKKQVVHQIQKTPTINLIIRVFLHFGDPPGARTQDPNIKSVVLYQLS